MMITTAIRCPNNMVMVFDEKGEQVPEYQGQYEEVRGSILKDAPLDAVFGYLFDTSPEIIEIPKGEW
ncbi:hypothetical protein ACFLU1_03865 [Chloroflexota bacterium]